MPATPRAGSSCGLAAGYGCLVAADGREAVEAFRARRLHLVVTDLHLPVMSGIEVFREVRREDEVHLQLTRVQLFGCCRMPA